MSDTLRKTLVELVEIDRALIEYRSTHRNVLSLARFAPDAAEQECDRIAGEIRRLTRRQAETAAIYGARADLEELARNLAVVRETALQLKSQPGVLDLLRTMTADLAAVGSIASSETIRSRAEVAQELPPPPPGDEIAIRIRWLHVAFESVWTSLRAMVDAGKVDAAAAIGREIADDFAADAKRIEARLQEVGLVR